MWIVRNDSFLSAVKDRDVENGLVVRARVKEDLMRAFPEMIDDIIESSDSDYRFRIFMDKEELIGMLIDTVDNIKYTNFKDSVKEPWRKTAYNSIWGTMYGVQNAIYGQQDADEWYKTYRYRYHNYSNVGGYDYEPYYNKKRNTKKNDHASI